MTKRLSSKVLAVILTLAICATTVLGCLISVSAAEPCYKFASGVFTDAELTQATIDVTFNAQANVAEGFAAGEFDWAEVGADADDYLVLEKVDAVTAGVNVTVDGDHIIFDGGDATTEVILKFTFGFSGGKATDKEYKVTLNNVQLANSDIAFYTETANAYGTISAGCKHVIAVKGDQIVVDGVNGYSIYAESFCTLCDDEFGYQLVPSVDDIAVKEDADEGTIDLLEFGDYLKEMGSTSTWYDTKVADNGETGADWDNAIIIDSAEEFVYLCKAAHDETIGKYYKVADGIAGFDLSKGNLNLDGTLAENIDKIKGGAKNHSGGTPGFQGYFDGNGVTVYGAWANHTEGNVAAYAGLFSCAKGTVTIKNINVKFASFTAKNAAGGIVGYHIGDGTNTLTIENCSVTDSHLEITTNGNSRGVGAILGYTTNCASTGSGWINGPTIIKNCYVNLDEDYFISLNERGTQTDSSLEGIHGGLAAAVNTSALRVSDCVVIGIKPYASTSNTTNNLIQHSGPAGKYTNVYTDAASGAQEIGGTTVNNQNYTGRVISLTADQMKGAAAAQNMNLDWSVWELGGEGEYPTIAHPNKVVDTIYWNGTVATGIDEGTGTDTDPYIISSVEELAYVVGLGNATEGKYYKIADGIKNIVLQPYAYGSDILALEDAAAVGAYFESGNITPIQWIYKGWAANAFSGKFDGNGATIYGLYSTGEKNSNPALFPAVDAGAEFSNLAIKNSYVYGKSGWDAGIFAAIVCSGTYGNGTDNSIIKFDNCAIVNNYFRYYADRGALFFATAQKDTAAFNNCLVYGNDAKNTDGSLASVALNMYNDFIDAEGNYVYARYNNMLVMGNLPYAPKISYRWSAPECFSNVYTDAPAGEVYSGHPFSEAQIKSINVVDALGSNAQTTMPNLAWGTDWVLGAAGKYPTLAVFGAATDTDSTSTPEYTLIGTTVGYNDNGSFDFNFHFVPNSTNVDATLYVGTVDGSKFMKLAPVASSLRDDLGETAMMFTIPNLSAKDMEKVWLPTVVVNGAATSWGKTEVIALADYATAVIEGAYDTADKKVAAALLNYGYAAKDALNTSSTEKQVATKIVYTPSNMYDGSFMDGTHGTGTEADPYIISTYGHWRYIAEKATFDETYGKFFKVDPTIKMFVFQSESYMNKLGGLDAFLKLDAEGVKTALSTESGRTYHNAGGYLSTDNIEFAGTLDGSGVQIVAMYNGCGLFSQVCEGASFKNLTVSHSYMSSGWYSGAVVGYVNSDTATKTNIGTISFENIILHDNYQTTSGGGWAQTGLLLGTVNAQWVAINIENVIAYDNIALGQVSSSDTTMKECGLVGQFQNGWSGGRANPNGSYKNIITLGNAPYPVVAKQGQGSKPEYFVNVYTDTITTETPGGQNSDVGLKPAEWSSYDITLIDAGEDNANIKNGGAAELCPKLDWTSGWINATESGYPAPVQKNIEIQSSGITIYWDGSNDGEGSISAVNDTNAAGTSWDDPIIIDNAKELYYVLRVAGVNYTVGKYFKVADGIDKMVLQPEGVLDLDKLLACEDGTAVKEYFETLNASGLKSWSKTAVFDGNIDGNGVEILGLYDTSSNLAGFVGAFDGGAKSTTGTAAADVAYDNVGIEVKNFVVKNAYLVSNNRLGVFGSQAYAPGWGANVHGILNLDNCAVINCYLNNTEKVYSSNHSGVVVGDVGEVVKMNNMLVYGNNATDVNGHALWLRGSGLKNDRTDDNGEFINNTVNNSIILGADPFFGKDGSYSIQNRRNDLNCFENLFTDSAIPTYQTFTATDAKQISAADVTGAKANSIVDKLNANGTVWYVGAIGDMPGFKPAGNMPAVFESVYDRIVFDTPDVEGAGTVYNTAGNMVFGVYQTALSLKANPYMSFAFAFAGEYKTNRENIKIRFTYTQNGETVVGNPIAVPAYTGEDIVNVNGWTNTTANGRFHTYKATDVPVEAWANGVKIEASYNGGAWQDFGTYGIEGLGMQFEALSKTQPGAYYATRAEAAKALLFYVQAINARYGNQ